ncbi:MAG: hypothetical protein IKV62_02675 [Bacteroidales bacterium]|nr:hypothetical protein [Bacteroidales bacterium]
MDLKQAYESIIQDLKRQLDAEMPLAKEADDTLVAKGLLFNPAEAAALFTDPIDGYVDRIVEEVSTESCNGHRYTVALYQRDDEAALCDAIADLGFAQVQRKPVVKKAKPAGEYENAVAFVLGLYTVFVILHSGFTSADFTRLHKRAIYNFYLNHSSRQIRHVYDTGWPGKYLPRNIFYPLG